MYGSRSAGKGATMRSIIGALLFAVVASISGQQVPSMPAAVTAAEEAAKQLSEPGVYLSTPAASPRLTRIAPVTAGEIDIRTTSKDEPVMAAFEGSRAAVRVASGEPVFFVYRTPDAIDPKGSRAELWLVRLAGESGSRRLRIGTAGTDARRRQTITVRIRDEAQPLVVEALSNDLQRVTSASPLPPGEYALVSPMIFIEAVDRFVLRPGRGSIRLRTPVFDFAIDPE